MAIAFAESDAHDFGMKAPFPSHSSPGVSEAGARSADRIAREQSLLDEAERDLAAGRSLTGASLDSWLTDWADGKPVDVPDHGGL